MAYIESDPNRSFNAVNDVVKIREAIFLGASNEQLYAWIEAQIGSLLTEHGPIDNQRQPIFYYDVLDKGKDQEPEIYFGNGKEFGDQHVSFSTMERDYPYVALGWQKLAKLFVDPDTKVGDGIVWISPMKFYLKPRISGDKPSSYDVLNFYKIILRRGDHTQILGQTIKLNGALTDRQYAALLNWHGWKTEQKELSPEKTVTSPVKFALGNITLGQHYEWLNELSIADREFKFLLTGSDNEIVKKRVFVKLQKYLSKFKEYLTVGNINAVQNLIWKLVWEIKDGDAIRLGIDPMLARMQYLQMQDMMTHRLMSTSPIDNTVEKFGFNGILESKGHCRVHGAYEGDKCQKCHKKN